MNFHAAKFLLPCLLATAPVQAQTIDILHFWTNPGEQAALKVFQESFEERGGEWHSSERSNVDEVRRTAIEWISDGIPPTAIQWHAGASIVTLRELGVIRSLDDIIDTSGYRNAIHPIVLSAIESDGELTAVPINIHGDNWAWYNAGIYRSLGLEIPASWSEFLEQAAIIKEAGYIPLAIGGNNWEQRLLFNTVMVDAGGGALYRAVSEGTPLSPEQHDQLVKAFEVFLALGDFVSPDFRSLEGWSDATRQIINGEAAVQIMGDWAKGDLLAAGLSPDEDFLCDMAPGNRDAYLLVVDVFLLPDNTLDAEVEAQRQFVEIALDPGNQVEFSRRKGSLPVNRNVDVSSLDACAQRGWNTLKNPANQFPAPPLLLAEAVSLTIDDFLNSLWGNDTITPEEAAATLVEAIRNAG